MPLFLPTYLLVLDEDSKTFFIWVLCKRFMSAMRNRYQASSHDDIAMEYSADIKIEW